METSRYASRLAPDSRVLPSGRPLQPAPTRTSDIAHLSDGSPQFLPEEPDDARLTGGTRSLSRRLLALNIPGLAPAKTKTASPRLGDPSRKLRARKPSLTKAHLVPHDA